ncbi:cytochrome P450 [Colletotrichum acutatum]|uniref:Cytochrome P450 n=1 Tax=Glomerella acutata TaxID=27357 RepID=A0AAD8UFE8_GLOAC|nr:cytochrome P450 [Colletotrichum acutatum]KAK1722931.1 cytochrome P450 [Colletotrichum acutatum]
MKDFDGGRERVMSRNVTRNVINNDPVTAAPPGRSSTKLPILTVYLASQKTYIVNSPELIALISRRSKEVDGNVPFVTIVYGKLFAFSQTDISELLRNPLQKGSLRQEAHAMEHSLLSPGSLSLKEVYEEIFNGLANHVNNISEGPRTIALQNWLQEIFTISTAKALHGPDGPFTNNKELLQAFWDFENGLKALTMGVFPTITAAKPAAARQKIVDALLQYFGDSFPENTASELIRRTRRLALDHSRGPEFIARYGLGLMTGFLINTVPAVFWIILRIAKDEDMLKKVRLELSLIIQPCAHDESFSTLEVAAIRKSCPLLMSICHETLRCISSSTGTFLVHQDAEIGDEYILKKGAIVQMAATAIHSNPDVWGADADAFEPERFLRPSKVHPAANRTFGGGSTLCPGRHLAVDEMITFTAMFLSKFDVTFPDGADSLPKEDDTNMLSVKKPNSDVLVGIRTRPETKHQKWCFSTGTLKM